MSPPPPPCCQKNHRHASATCARGLRSSARRRNEAGLLPFLIDPRLKDLTMPVTLIWGAHDGLLPVVYAETLHKRIAGSRLHIIDNAAHIPHRQAPREFVRLVQEALR